jgi:photosystem II stability/assembly factor-like uncharacterized protein
VTGAALAAAVVLAAASCAGHGRTAADRSATPSATPTGPGGGPVGNTPPGTFAPATASFVTAQLGFALGVSPCLPAGITLCPALLRTADGGAQWSAVPAPPLLVLTDPTAHPLLRFADPLDGVASDGRAGSPLDVTTDGGATWHLLRLPGAPAGARVSALAATDDRFVVVAGDALSQRAWTADADDGVFSPTGPVLPGTGSAASLATAGAEGWLVAGPATSGRRPTLLHTVDGGLSWSVVAAPCAVGESAVAAAVAGRVLLVCQATPTGVAADRQTFVALAGRADPDAGRRPDFRAVGSVSGEGFLSGVAMSSARSVVVATSSDADQLLHSSDGGRVYALTYSSQAGGQGQGLFDLGFADATHGSVVLGSSGTYALQLSLGIKDVPTTRLLLTTDGGAHWAQAVFVR